MPGGSWSGRPLFMLPLRASAGPGPFVPTMPSRGNAADIVYISACHGEWKFSCDLQGVQLASTTKNGSAIVPAMGTYPTWRWILTNALPPGSKVDGCLAFQGFQGFQEFKFLGACELGQYFVSVSVCELCCRSACRFSSALGEFGFAVLPQSKAAQISINIQLDSECFLGMERRARTWPAVAHQLWHHLRASAQASGLYTSTSAGSALSAA